MIPYLGTGVVDGGEELRSSSPPSPTSNENDTVIRSVKSSQRFVIEHRAAIEKSDDFSICRSIINNRLIYRFFENRNAPSAATNRVQNVSDYELNYDLYLKDDDSEQQPICKAPKNPSSHAFGCKIKGIFDGFNGNEMRNIIAHMKHRRSNRGGPWITNFMISGKMEKIVDDRLRDCLQHFSRIHPDTGRIIGSIRGNDFFNFGGLHNNLGNTGKVWLENLIRGKRCRRKIHKFHPIIPSKNADEVAKPDPTETTYPSPDEPDIQDYGLDFEQERERCLKDQVLFEDPEFPATNKSLYYRTRPTQIIEWKRPGQIVPNPKLITQGESRFDVKQGALGNCWFLAALSNITLYDALFYRVVPPNQSFTDDYAGIFHFQFWHYGKWVDVVVDDRLPTVNGRLYYLHSNDNNEFWSALVEKAYAKLHGGYEQLDGGTTAEALEDFTGGLTEYFDLRKVDKSTVLAALVKGIEMGSLFGCSIDADANIREAQLQNGLICGHAYSITAIHTVTYYGEDLTLLRLRNPWGDKEWNGAWSDNSFEWQKIDESTKKEMEIQFGRDGEFWISFDDFFSNFTQLECCNLTADIFDEIAQMTGVNVAENQTADDEKTWNEVLEHNEWSSEHGTAGGCNNNTTTYPNNPQFLLDFTAPHESAESDGNVTVIVAVLQKYRRELRPQGKDLLPIGVSIYEHTETRQRLNAEFFARHRAIARTTIYVNTREVTVRFRIPPGQYVVVPSTFDPFDDGQFLLRVYANGRLHSRLL